SGATMFTKRAAARYVPERTLLLDVVLAHRCRDEAARSCPNDQSCGLEGCEPILVTDLPDFVEGVDASLPTHRNDGGVGVDACTAVCDGECVDTSSDPSHCGSCDNACTAPPGATPTCDSGECGFECDDGLHLCGDACVSSTSLES